MRRDESPPEPHHVLILKVLAQSGELQGSESANWPEHVPEKVLQVEESSRGSGRVFGGKADSVRTWDELSQNRTPQPRVKPALLANSLKMRCRLTNRLELLVPYEHDENR